MKKILISFIALVYYKAGMSQQPEIKREFKTMIKAALAQGQRHIVVAPGEYYMDLKDGVPLTLDSLHDVEIIGNGAEIICNAPSQAIEIKNCKNLTISGISIDYDPLPFTEGKIIDMDTAKRMWMDVKIYEGYRTDMIEGRKPDRFQVFDAQTHNLKKNLYTYFGGAFSKVEKTGDHLFRFYKSSFNKDACEEINDDVVFSLPYSSRMRTHAIVLSKSSNVHLKDVTLYAGNCFGFFEMECDKNTYDHCRVTIRQNDARYSYPRLRSNNADAFHSKYAIRGPQVTNCEFLYQGDDGIAINASFYRVVSGQGNKIFVDEDEQGMKIRAGHRVRFVDSEGNVLTDAKVLKIETVTDFPASGLDSMFHVFKMNPAKRASLLLLTLDTLLAINAGTVVSSLDMAGEAFVVKNNTVGCTRARGILIKSSNGTIENNKVVGCELGGIVLAPELFWLEAGFSRNVLIRNNVVKDCMFANSSYGIEQAAPISVVAINTKDSIAPAGGFQNIRIINNTIENSPIPAIMLTSSTGATISGNRISISSEIKRTHGKRFGVDNTQVVWVKNSEEVKMSGNKIKQTH